MPDDMTDDSADVLWHVDMEDFPDAGYGLTVSALVTQTNQTDLEVTVHSDYDYRPTEGDAIMHKDDIIRLLLDAGIVTESVEFGED